MKLIVNGSGHEHRDGGSLKELLDELGAVDDRVAIIVNDRVVPRHAWDGVRLKEGDRVEVLTFMGGG
jgi:sulfur carrier protein